tara:strand:- start:3 stop:257 length:255 start_codon:yes stop_codon:yes gene_type:complete
MKSRGLDGFYPKELDFFVQLPLPTAILGYSRNLTVLLSTEKTCVSGNQEAIIEPMGWPAASPGDSANLQNIPRSLKTDLVHVTR